MKLLSELILMGIEGVYIFKSDSGITLYSKKNVDVQEDLFSAFLSALKGFFNSFALGGLSSFASENYIVYLASNNNVLTALVVSNDDKSDKYFNIAFEICVEFFKEYKSVVESRNAVNVKNKERFDVILDNILSKSEELSTTQQELIKLYKVSSNGDLELLDFINEDHLYNQNLFIAVNFVTKQVYVVENSELSPSNRLLFLAGKAVNELNQKEFKSEFTVRNVSDPWDLERIIDQIKNLLTGESIKL